MTTTDTAHWSNGPLHTALVAALPAFVREPFSAAPKLNIPKLKDAIGKSHEAVYKWLRTNRLSPRNAQSIIDLAHGDANKAALRQVGRKAPKIEDLSPFYLP